ncbi:hypothetical protein TcCL_ESM01896 [Trypanosoma cruzi]|uniref:Uncharacterized protein n=2 Tax=Trypanosoma cruzi TaxID=5693 RepID=Q4E4G6_TRYCC|nr:hypothetical protein, conserved [Trypanosoma cruzi]EAN99687.1 hypothetical protein, conserved [Trypanosoma cruzi]KAF5221070.1 hypothetical protein ECC02_005937 [Trypanosoma cruzi]RNC60394.1 hypothetical protein TcCL_ESM01896 [Trypanosoma cruzi]|eukprot:XP_821538.1 hypothetical protein [Trypanosoma cruzi strain CL Brener]
MTMALLRIARPPVSRLLVAGAHYHTVSDALTEEERRHLEQELPPRELLREFRTKDQPPDGEGDDDVKVPGDSFGIMRNRVVFYRPIPREVHAGALGELFPEGCHPMRSVNAATLRRLCGRFGVSLEEAAAAMLEAELDINVAVDLLVRRKGIKAPFGSFGLVGFENYAPETFCMVNFILPSFEATRDDEVLDAIHELTLSAAELPLDITKEELLNKFLNHWTIEDGRNCREVMNSFDITAQSIVMLPYGEYSVQGFYIFNPVKEDVPNIGTGAAACCLDLRTGIHNRFRFHVERVADSVSEHVLRELVHYGQNIHLLRQAYWFKPDYSVEEYIRFKESLLQPSASIFEMRYAVLTAAPYGLEGYRNLVEMEKLKVAQHKYEKHYEDFISPGKWLTSDNAQLQTVAAGSGDAPGSILHMQTNTPSISKTAMETRTAPLRHVLEKSIQAHGDRVFDRFYRMNYH